MPILRSDVGADEFLEEGLELKKVSDDADVLKIQPGRKDVGKGVSLDLRELQASPDHRQDEGD